jgi:hypothetical protein
MTKGKLSDINQNVYNQDERDMQRRRITDRTSGSEVLRAQQKVQEQENSREFAWKATRWAWKGITNIAQSLATPNTNRRPRISQMPGSRSEMDIVRQPSLGRLKMNGLRYRDLRGRRLSKHDVYDRGK